MARKRKISRVQKHRKYFLKWFKRLKTWQKALVLGGGAMSVIAVCLVVVPALCMVISFIASFGKIQTPEIKEEEIVINKLDESVGKGYTNFVLFGGDSRSGNVTRNLNTDTIIVVSLNNETKEIKMVSVYRDTLLDMTNGNIQKCNSAYARGGAAQAINMLNMNLDLNIKKYVTVDFSAVVDLVDMVGGVEIDVKEKERLEANKFIAETARASKKQATYIRSAGLQTLNGVQATTYARIRKGVGDDYARTDRQRLVIQKVIEKAKKSDFATLTKIANELFPRIATNFTLTEILSYAKDITKYTFPDSSGFPFEKASGSIRGRGSSVFTSNLKKNVSMLHEFLYGTKNYQPSSTVSKISANIAELISSQKITITIPETSVQPGTGGEGQTPETGGDGQTPGTGGEGQTPGTGGDGQTPGGDTSGGEDQTPGGDSTGGDTGSTPGGEGQTPGGSTPGGSDGGTSDGSDGGTQDGGESTE